MAPVNRESCCELCDGWLLSDGTPDVWWTSGGGRRGPFEIFQAFSQDSLLRPVLPSRRPLPRRLVRSSPPSMSPGQRCPHGPATRPRATTRTARWDPVEQRSPAAVCRPFPGRVNTSPTTGRFLVLPS